MLRYKGSLIINYPLYKLTHREITHEMKDSVSGVILSTLECFPVMN